MPATNHHRPYQGYPYASPPVNDAPSIDSATASRWNNLPKKQQSYQGYPYVNPPVNDVPSIDSATASRWNNLPRKQVDIPLQRIDPAVYVNTPDRANPNHRPGFLPMKPDPDPSPVVYIDMPEGSGSYVSTERRYSSSDDEAEPSTDRQDKRKSTEDPVVYIDMPVTNGSDVAHSPQNEDRQEEPEYVQETIFFNPFENRRMEMHKDETRRDSESDDESTVSSLPYRRPLPRIRPNTLDLHGAGSSSGASSNPASSSASGQPSMMSKETMLYGQDEGGFPMSPIPVSEFPEPPPAYAEIDRVSSPVVEPQEPIVEQPRREEPPRTQVILPRDPAPTTPIGLPNSERKYLNCHHCGMRVHTLVIRENGTITHATAMMCFIICMLPCVAFIYCTDVLKIKNHYCPSCNKIIGYELPFGGKKIVYVN